MVIVLDFLLKLIFAGRIWCFYGRNEHSRIQEPESFEHDGFIDLLLSSGKLSGSALDRARRGAAQTQDSLVTILTKLGLLSEGNLVRFYLPIIKCRCSLGSAFPNAPVLSEHR